MSLLIPIACIVVIAASVALAIYWGAVLYHIAATMRSIPTCRDALATPAAADLRKADAPKVCVIVPAHNEQGVVGKLATSLIKQDYPNLSAVFALDRCTDGTADEIRHATAGADHIEIFPISECPPDWAGKVNAIWRAVNSCRCARESDLLLFADADTEFSPELVRAAVALLRARSLAMLSLMSTLTTTELFERIAQPAAGMELMRQYPLARANATKHRRAFANGQFILFSREAYFAISGHESVKDSVLEDIELARIVERRGLAAGLFFADNLLRCRMYSTFDEFTRGWKRIYTEAANRRVARLDSVAWRVRILGTILPAVSFGGAAALLASGGVRFPTGLAGPAVLTAIIALAFFVAALVWSYRISRVPVAYTLLYPVGAWQVGSILHAASKDLRSGEPIRWGGREYVRTPR